MDNPSRRHAEPFDRKKKIGINQRGMLFVLFNEVHTYIYLHAYTQIYMHTYMCVCERVCV